MAWFKRNKTNDAPFSSVTAAPNLQDLKRKARNRLIGMLVLVLAAIASFAFLLDSQPRPGEREIVYEIPERGEQVSVSVPAKAHSAGAAAKNKASISEEASLSADETLLDTPQAARARRKAALAGSASETEEFLIDEAPIAAGSDTPQATAEQERREQEQVQTQAREKAREQARNAADKADKAAEKKLAQEPAAKKAAAAAAAEKKAQEAERARALLEGKKPSATSNTADKSNKTDSERIVVQFGSFSDPSKAAEVRRKVEGAGLKTYAQEIDTPKGKLTRLRVGPYTKASEAEAAAKKIKALGLPAAILTL